MAINFDKYLDSTRTHYIANTGHDERGKYRGGAAGDQGGEYTLRSWYSRPWTVVLRYPDTAVGLEIAKLSIEAALNDDIGYDQGSRTTYWQALVKAGYDPGDIRTCCETDCTAATTANVKAAGHLLGIAALEDIPIDTYSGNMRARFVKAGFRASTDKKYLDSPDDLLPGDVLLCEGHHAAVNITYGEDVRKGTEDVPAERILKNGMSGQDVKRMQEGLIRLGYSCGRWGADGDFGDGTELALRKFQKRMGLKADGEFGPKSRAAMQKALDALDVSSDGGAVKIVGGRCYVRSAPRLEGRRLGVVSEGAALPYAGQTTSDGWLAVTYKGTTGWVSDKYARRTDESRERHRPIPLHSN